MIETKKIKKEVKKVSTSTINKNLSVANQYYRKKGYKSAYDLLAVAYINLEGINLTGKEKYKYENDIVEIAEKIVNYVSKNLENFKGNQKSQNIKILEKTVELINKIQESKKEYKRLKMSEVIAIIGLLGGTLQIIASFANINIHLSPGAGVLSNWKFLPGIVLLIIGLIASFFWMKKRRK